MDILQPRLLLLAWGAVAVSAVAPQLAMAQRMARPAAPAMGTMPRPMFNPNAASMGSFNGFSRPSFGMMAYPGMSAASSYGAGSMGSRSGMGGYGGGTSGSQSGGQGGSYGGGSQPYGGDSGAGSRAPSDDNSLGRVLTAAGVPNTGGRLQWPVGLRAVGGPEGVALRRQIEALFQYGTEQTQAGAVSSHLVQELARSSKALRQILARDREERFSLPLRSYEDGERFLNRLDHARKLLEADSGPPEATVP